MHVGMVPVTEENKLSAKQIFNRKELVSLQDDFHAYMVEKGFIWNVVYQVIKACRNAKIQGNDRKRRDKSFRKEMGQCLQKKK